MIVTKNWGSYYDELEEEEGERGRKGKGVRGNALH